VAKGADAEEVEDVAALSQDARSAPAFPAEPGIELRIPGLRLVEELGRGAHAVVYRAVRDGTGYAVKVLNSSSGHPPGALTAFRREAALLASVAHPGLARVHEVGAVDGRPYLVMDLVDGRPLRDLLTGAPLSVEWVTGLALDVADALAAVHLRGVVHRDVTPANVMITTAGPARLIDFGLAAHGASRSGDQTVGTLVYSAPEQAGTLNRPVDQRSDLYALGVLLYECLAGRPPFESDDVGELLRMHSTSPPPPLPEPAGPLAAGLVPTVLRLLAKDPDDRYSTAEALLRDLRGLAGSDRAPARDAAAARTAPPAAGARATAGTGLSGRADELRQLEQHWRAVLDGRGRAALVRGPAGSGKTRLAEELAGQVAGAGYLVLHGKANRDAAVPLAPLRSAIEAYLAGCDAMPPAECERRHAQLRESAGSTAALLGMMSPALASVLRAGELPVGDWQDQFPGAAVGFLTALSGLAGGLLLQVDDLQWLDSSSQRVLGLLAAELAGAPVLLLCTARDDAGSAAATAGLDGALDLDLTLGPLDEGGVADLLAAELPGLHTESTLSQLLTARGNGNPFVILEYLRAIMDAGLLRPSWGSWVLDEAGLDALALPDDVLGLVVSRVDGLGAGTRLILTVAAALGARFNAAVMVAACHEGPDVVLAALAEAVTHRLLTASDHGWHVFLHDRIREALLEQLDDAGRRAVHQRLAEVMDRLPERDDELVYATAAHFVRGDTGQAPARAFAACRAAGNLALTHQFPAQAVEFLAAAAATGQPLDAEFLLMYGTALQRDGRFDAAQEQLRAALAGSAEPLVRAEVLCRLAEVYRAEWNAAAAYAAVQQGLRELGAPMPGNRFLLVASTLTSFATGILIGLTGVAAGRLNGTRRARYELVADLHTSAGYIGTELRRPDILMLHNLRSVYWVNRLGSGRQFAAATVGLGFLPGVLGLWRIADRCFRRGERAALQLADPELPAVVAYFRGITAYLGRRDDGEVLARAIIEHGRWLDTGLFADGVASLCADAATRGVTAEATAWMRQGWNRLSAAGSGGERTSLLSSRGVTDRMTGRAADAAAALRHAQDVLGETGGPGLRAHIAAVAVHTLHEEGERGERFDAAVEQLQRFYPKPRRALRAERGIFLTIALGRLAQCRTAPTAEREARLVQAHAAVEQLRAVANTNHLRGCLTMVSADLQLLRGDPRQALTTLAAPAPVWPDAPLLAYEQARVRARAHAALHQPAPSVRQARYAAAIAEEQGWRHRVRWIQTEFGTAPAATRSHTSENVVAGQLQRQWLRALEEISRAAARVLDPDAVIRITLDETLRILNAERAFLFLTSGGPDRPGTSATPGDGPATAGEGDDGALLPYLGRDTSGQDLTELARYSTSLVERVRRSREPTVVTGTEEGEALGSQSIVAHGLRSILVAPLQLGNRLVGVVYLDSQIAKGIFTADDADILIALTTYIAMTLETARAAQLEVSARTAHRARELAEELRAAATAMSATLDPDEVLSRLQDQTEQLLACRGSCLLVTGEDGGYTRHPHRAGDPAGDREPVRPADPVDPALARQLSVLVHSVLTEQGATVSNAPLPAGLLPDRDGDGCEEWIALPLVGTDRAIGVLLLLPERSEDVEPYAQLAATLVTQAMTAYDRALLFGQVAALAVVDDLTGIANRRQFFHLARRDFASCRRGHRDLTALMIDIDHFKRINDEYGHPTGDDVIKTVAARLAGMVRATDALGRYGGEEFALIMTDTDEATSADTAQRVRAVIADAEIDTRSGPISVTISVGFTQLRAADDDIADVLARADRALYHAKESGRNQVSPG
jgi:eukaryotic-like serine/threonine-protein kinase